MLANRFLIHLCPSSSVKCYWDHKGQHKKVMEFKEFSANLTVYLRVCDVDTVSPPDHQSLKSEAKMLVVSPRN